MRYRLLASYQGAPYEAGVGPDETGVVLFAACPPPEELRFEPATGHWRKEVSRADVQMLYESRPVGTFRGERCVILDDLTDRLHIAYLGHDAHRAERLGFWEVDRGVFELITPRQEVIDIVEQRLPLTPQGDGTRPGPDPAASGRTAGYGQELANGSGPGSLPMGHEVSPDRWSPGYSGEARDGLAEFARDGLAQLTRESQAGGLQAGQAPVRPFDASDVSIPAVDQAPLPLEAEARRAATAAGRRGQQDQDAPPGARRTSAAEAAARVSPQPPVPVTPAGISEPSSGMQPGADAASAVPSWTPKAPIPPQRHAHAETPQAELAQPEKAQPEAAQPEAVEPAEAPQRTVATAARATAAQAPEVPQATEAPQQAGQAPAGQMPQQPVQGQQAPAQAQPAPLQAQPAPLQAQPAPLQAQPPLRPATPLQAQPTPLQAEQSPLQAEAASVQAQAAALIESALIHGVPLPPPAETSRQPEPAPGREPAPGQLGAQNGASFAGQPATGVPRGAVPVEDYLTGRSELPLAAPTRPGASAEPYGPPPGGSAAMAADEQRQFGGVALASPPQPRRESRPQDEPSTSGSHQSEALVQPAPRRRRAARRRLPTQRIFSDLAAQAGIPASAYAIGEDVDGAMCLVRTEDGFEVFNSLAAARHEVRVFQDEESAYFYLFGVLVAEAVRTGVLVPRHD